MTEKALIFAGHRLHGWWRHMGDQFGFPATVLTDRRGEGDRWLTDDFYQAYRRRRAGGATRFDLLHEREVRDVIARCRVLRWMPVRQAEAMALAMAEAVDRVLDEERPTAILGTTIDSYVQDVLSRRAEARGIPHFEITTSALPNMAMLLQRGRLIEVVGEPSVEQVDAKLEQLLSPLYAPTSAFRPGDFSAQRFLKTLTYFRARAAFFRLYGLWRRDSLNQHLLDAQPFLGHKAGYSDVGIVSRLDRHWRNRLAAFPKDRRLFLGLQLFPEASIDYWVSDLGLVDYENMLVEAVQAFAQAGFLVLVKDHPFQFGFRQLDLIDRLRAVPNVVLVPYDVTSNELLTLVGATFTTTGTPGLQAALLGLKSVVTPNYYSTDDRDFVLLRSRADVPGLPTRLLAMPQPDDLRARQRRIVAKLMRGSFDADYFSFQNFDSRRPNPGATGFGRQLGRMLVQQLQARPQQR